MRFQNLCWRLTRRQDGEPGFDNVPSSLQGSVDDHDTTNVDVRRSTGWWRSLLSPDVTMVPYVDAASKAQLPSHRGPIRTRGVSFSESYVEIPMLERASGRQELLPKSDDIGCMSYVIDFMIDVLFHALPVPGCAANAVLSRCSFTVRH